MINLISDTVTRPTPGMMQAMMQAEVGDDVFGEDPTVRRLEEKAAELIGHEAALFCPSGTMTNQIALKAHTRPLDEVICDWMSHIYQYEVGAYAFHSGIGINLIHTPRGILSAAQIEAAVRPRHDWLPVSRLVVIENSCNRGGGSVYPPETLRHISAACRRLGLALHLDGARLFNALAVSGMNAREIGALTDSVSLCLSKGLGAPVGSVLTGPRDWIAECRRIRKAMGGGMRQAGYLAAAGIYALDCHVERLHDDHMHARKLADTLAALSYVRNLRDVETNIVIFDVAQAGGAVPFLSFLEKNGVRAAGFGPETVRLVTHLDVTGEMIDRACKILQAYEKC